MISSLLSLMWIDLASPVAISTEVLLLPVVKKKRHIALYLFFVYFWYALLGFGIYVGVDVFLKDYYLRLYERYTFTFGAVKLLISAGCLFGLAYMIRYIIKVAKKETSLSIDSMLHFKTVHPGILILVALVQCIAEYPTCFPILTFIGIMASKNTPIVTALVYISVFCIASVLPSFAVYALSFKLNEKSFKKVVDVIQKIFSWMCMIFIPIILIIIIVWSCYTGIYDVGILR